jgi:hypothetical protein
MIIARTRENLLSQLPQIVIRVDTAVVPIAPHHPDCVISDPPNFLKLQLFVLFMLYNPQERWFPLFFYWHRSQRAGVPSSLSPKLPTLRTRASAPK